MSRRSLRDHPSVALAERRETRACAYPASDFTAAARALGRGQLVVDRVFDEVFPLSLRRASSVHWTPVEIAMRAVKLLAIKPNATILDIGAGIGKFCIVAAAAIGGGARVRGVEHRPHFVAIARDAARKTGVDVDFVHGTIDAQDPASVNGIYLFNPFAENLSSPEDHLDNSVELSEERFWRDIDSTERFLRAACVGTRVVTYCGWGGAMPSEYQLVMSEARASALELWVKTDRKQPQIAIATTSSNKTGIGATPLGALRERAVAAGKATAWEGQ